MEEFDKKVEEIVEELLEKYLFSTYSEHFRKLAEIEDLTALSKEEREMYDESIKVMRDNYAVWKTALEESVVEGMKEGIAEGIAEVRIKNARAMIAEGISAEDIAEITGLSLEEIQAL